MAKGPLVPMLIRRMLAGKFKLGLDEPTRPATNLGNDVKIAAA